MRLDDLISPIRISNMSYEELLKRVREIRKNRESYEPPVKKRKSTKQRVARKSKIDKLLEGMSEDERKALLESLKK